MEDQKRVLIADFDELGRFGIKTVCKSIDDVEVMTASTKEEALQVINGDETPDLVIVDPLLDFSKGPLEAEVDVNKGSLGVITEAVSNGIRVLIVTALVERVRNKLSEMGMGESYCDIIKKGSGWDVTHDAVIRALAD